MWCGLCKRVTQPIHHCVFRTIEEANNEMELTTEQQPAQQVYNNTKELRFAVARQHPFSKRYKTNFKKLHASRTAAEAEALRLASNIGGRYYVVEVVAVTNYIKEV